MQFIKSVSLGGLVACCLLSTHCFAQSDENRRAVEHYQAAALASVAGRTGESIDQLKQAIAAGYPQPHAVLSNESFRNLLANAELRSTLREMLRQRPAQGQLIMVTPQEPGEPLEITGTVRDESGHPIAGAVISFYHTDAAGWYSANSTSGRNPRLFGYVATDTAGKYRIRTIMPAPYADSAGPRHVHVGTKADGYHTLDGHRASLYFADDPNLTGATLTEIRNDGCTIVERERHPAGHWTCRHPITLRTQD